MDIYLDYYSISSDSTCHIQFIVLYADFNNAE